MLKAVLIDDEEIALDVLEIVLQEVGGVSVEGKFLHVDDAMAYLSESKVDLVFLDIEMPGMNGLTVAERLSLRWPHMQIIFVTAYQEYALEAFEVNAFGYLLKPVSKERLAKTLERFRRRTEGKSEPSTAVASGETASLEQTPVPDEIHFRLNLLGSMELYDSGNNLVTWRTKKAKEMFAYLWHHDGTPVQRHRILDDLWPELTFDRSQALFHTTLYHLRNTLKQVGYPHMVMYGDERYWLRTEQTVSDVNRLFTLMNEPGEDRDAVAELTAIYRGDYLEADDYAWAVPRRAELRTAYLRTLEQLQQRLGRTEREAVLRKMIQIEPYAETYYRLLLRDLKEAGDNVAVQAVTELMKRRFQSELGIDMAFE
ncbi:Protein-glutamate methylesterase/protein-glutamine glutaminase [Paenibacillus solanacearum]|uniref:Protein-glutamate methylesterase/protein-glutamine glutaminase n=1 Tax=Paenibacillus solanacearum TaxID=2048548 RepID=A0A916K1B0_9BACL|nr:response regulator [Paenibacillus solanacearum]CAG7617127.1 Protein-glutamate methylesterase/protein-glutamine glutaminase [Paenibacillus solanacearum]